MDISQMSEEDPYAVPNSTKGLKAYEDSMAQPTAIDQSYSGRTERSGRANYRSSILSRCQVEAEVSSQLSLTGAAASCNAALTARSCTC